MFRGQKARSKEQVTYLDGHKIGTNEEFRQTDNKEGTTVFLKLVLHKLKYNPQV